MACYHEQAIVNQLAKWGNGVHAKKYQYLQINYIKLQKSTFLFM